MMKSRNEYYQYIIDEISIKEVCDKLGMLTRPIGEDFVCSCIFHSDPRPSLHIYTETKSFYCFECYRGGSIFTLLEDKLECDFNEALKWLEREFPCLLKVKPRVNANLDSAFSKTGYEIACEQYANMTDMEKGELGNFAARRGYEAEFLKECGIYYAKGKKLYNVFVKNAHHHVAEMEKLKENQLISALPMRRTDQKIHYNDYFQKDRVIITLRNQKGKICGFAGRSVEEKDKPKYLFTKGLPKSQLLYRLDSVEKKLGKNGKSQKLFIVEGMFDALRLETMGYCAVAVLGNRIVDKQIEILERVIDKVRASISISLFFDTDKAGLDGTIASIKRIWKNKVLKKCYLEVQILKDGTKDPDEAFKGKSTTEGISYTAFEFLIRYYLKGEGERLPDVDLKESYANKNTEERILLLHKMEDIVPRQEWEELFDYYDRVGENSIIEDEIPDSVFSYQRIRGFILGNPVIEAITERNKRRLPDKKETGEKKDYRYQMQTALQIARTGYEREEIKLDDTTWERIALGADAFFDYLYEKLKKGESVPVPLITMKVPKKLNITRKKAMYCHEELLLQQYVLNELLTRGEHEGFERSIPAVRYEPGAKVYVTGYQYPDLAYETVSFAYQIDMSVISGSTEIKKGMYRPFYECWKSYIGYVQNGIEKLEGEVVYRVKLDVQGFYDNLRNYVIRDAIKDSIAEAVLYDSSKFACFRKEEVTGNQIAEILVEWILKELYKVDYYDSKDGILKQKPEYDCGIPQGPDLSSYIANVSLFTVDQKAQKVVREVNTGCEDGIIRARYARYVDDMIIVASSPDILLRIKSAIAAQLYELNLSLSPKTEEEDGLSKDDAFDWTMEERGGFGVSAGFDMPDDTSTSLMEEYESYEVTDRRGALKLMQSNLNALLYEGIERQEQEWETFFIIFFKTEEIRYMDIVRFSEMLIYHAVKQEKALIEAFQKIWEDGKKQAQVGTLFFEEGLEVLAFLDGCRRILFRQENPGNVESYKTWEIVNKKIKEEKEEICKWVYNSIPGKYILEENCWILNLKIIEFCKFTNVQSGKVMVAGADDISGQNEYWYRWKWHEVGDRAGLMELRPKSVILKEVLQNFHFFMEALRKIEKVEDFKDLKSILKNYETYNNVGEDILLGCFKIWASNNTIGNTEDSERAERALRVLLNTIPSDFKAEIIGQMVGLKEYLFSVNEDGQRYEYLPVYPGIKYPGIMLSIKDNVSSYIRGIKRVDLLDDEDNILNIESWKLINNESERKLFERKIVDSDIKLIKLRDYCQSDGKVNAQKALKFVADIYPMLREKLASVNVEIEAKFKNRKLVISAENVILELKENTIFGIDVENAYLISSQVTPNVVAVEKGNEQYELQVVYDNGSAYWISGYLLKDACKVEAIRFSALGLGDDEIRDAEMLKFSMRRLYGHTFQKNGDHYRKERSYENSVKRTINLIEGYLASSNKDKELFLIDAKIINSFIETKLNNEYGEFPDQGLGIAVWAKNYLRFGFRDLRLLFKKQENICVKTYPVERRVPKWYCYLADEIQLLDKNHSELLGLKVLAAGIFADAVLILMRMQVLECIRAFDENQRKSFLREAVDLPFQKLGLEGNELLITKGDFVAVYRNFVLNDREDDGVKNITHLGWLVLLAKVYEIDKKTNFIVTDAENRIDRNVLGKKLKNVADIITQIQQNELQDNLGFPFEEMNRFLCLWKKENVYKILQSLDIASAIYGAVVKKKFSSAYRQKKVGKQIRIDTGRSIYEEQKYFLTFGKAGSGITEVECCLMEPSQFIYTQTSIRGKVVGISTLAHEFGEILQQWENKSLKVEGEISKSSVGFSEERSKGNDVLEGDGVAAQKQQKIAQQILENSWENEVIYDFQSSAWERRGKTKFFKNADRIALFQFQIDSSYCHPAVEKCMIKIKNNEQGQILYDSCAEFRRRKLLEPVLKACAQFNVEILLLPEYSVRPETVQWMYEVMRDNPTYKFSIWAGTFRIPAGYTFDGNNTINISELNSTIFWHSAPLPVILDSGENGAEIVIKKFKKYPAVALKEDINPAPAYEIYNAFSPIMREYASEKKAAGKRRNVKDEKNVMPYFYDARDDVMELICAEFFAVASISNYPSFLKESLCAYSNYSKLDLLMKPEVYEDYEKKYRDNLMQFGEHTALYQRKKRYMRTPILLVPACATRAVDYYVFGQGFYLSAGLKTVFCNAVGTGGHGGSCFIGPDSWDDRNIKSDEYLMENTIYHGLKPGIFMQTSRLKNRGALGDWEQALLICDVYPELDKRSPNSESMMNAFSLVAHIPIFEEKNYDACCENNSECNYCNKYEQNKAKKRREELKKAVDKIKTHCNKKLNNSFFYDGENTIEKRDMEEVVKYLKNLGETYQSDWFARRAEYYEKYYKMYPQAWPAPALTDWLYVEIDYREFLSNSQKYMIQIPPSK